LKDGKRPLSKVLIGNVLKYVLLRLLFHILTAITNEVTSKQSMAT